MGSIGAAWRLILATLALAMPSVAVANTPSIDVRALAPLQLSSPDVTLSSLDGQPVVTTAAGTFILRDKARAWSPLREGGAAGPLSSGDAVVLDRSATPSARIEVAGLTEDAVSRRDCSLTQMPPAGQRSPRGPLA